LTKYGVSQDKIIVTGIPISLKFNKETDRKKIIDSLNFDENTPILLIVGGKIKYSVLRNIIENVEKKSALRFIVVAGRDKKLQKELENSSLKKNPKVKIFNFVDNIHDYMSVANLILTKAGGLTVAECMQKNLPMVINDFIPGQEGDNVKYIVSHGAGIEAKNTKKAIKVIINLMSRPEKIVKMKENCRRIAKPNASRDIADFVAKSLEKTK